MASRREMSYDAECMTGAMDDRQELERFHPVLLYSILEATRRFEPDFYTHLCRSYHLDAERILGLFREVVVVGGGQLEPLLRDLRSHPAYHDIVFLAGRNALLMWVDLRHIRRAPVGTPASAFRSLSSDLLPAFLGDASINILQRGELQFIEVQNSVFARGVSHEEPLCGYYTGLLTELAHFCGLMSATVSESSCSAMDPDSSTCVIQIGL